MSLRTDHLIQEAQIVPTTRRPALALTAVASALADVADAIRGVRGALQATFISPNELDSNFEPANIVDAMRDVARALRVAREPMKEEKKA